jgi:ribosomal protein S18 acetylase RimI-like enzyme
MKIATKRDKESIIKLLSVSFMENRSVNYLMPKNNRQRRISALMDYSFEVCNLFGKVYLSEDNKACALVSFPEQKRTTFKSILAEIKLIINSIGFENISKAIQREKTISKHYPAENIYYLWFIGVSPEFQGQGIGEKLMREILADADLMRRPIYLETSTLKNIPWYQKFGFEVYGELDFGYKLFLLRRNFQR